MRCWLLAIALCACADEPVDTRTDSAADAVEEVTDARPEVAIEIGPDTRDDVPSDVEADGDVSDVEADGDVSEVAEVCSADRIGSRRVQPAGGVVAFNELAFGEWLELHNTMAIDVDVSGWRIEGAVSYVVPEGTFIAPRAQLVIAAAPTEGALGPWSGTLARAGTLTLVSNGGRRMDALTWSARAPWPDAAVIAKRDPDLPSGFGESWRATSPTPGSLPPASIPHVVIAADATWRHTSSAPSGWNALGFDDSAWSEARAPFSRAPSGPVAMHATFTADNHFALYLGPADGTDLRFVGRDTQGDWTSSETFALTVEPGDHLFAAAWEDRGDAGSTQMLIGEVWHDDRRVLVTSADTLEVQLGPDDANPGNTAEPVIVVGDDYVTPVARAEAGSPWDGRIDHDYTGLCVWLDTFDANASTNQHETYAVFRSRAPLGAASSVLQGEAAFLRTPFETVAGMRYVLEGRAEGTIYVDGQVVAEVAGDVSRPLAVAPGAHVLAVAARGSLEVALTLRAEPEIVAPPIIDGAVVISEIMYHPSGDGSEWLELYNRTDAPIDLGGWQLADAVSHVFAPGTSIGANATLVIADDLAAFNRDYPGVAAIALESGGLANDGEQLELYDGCGRIVDRVRYTDGGRWPAYADGGGSSLVLRDVFADNDSPEAWVASDESARSTWQTISYRGVAEPSSVGPDGRWDELVVGLLDAGEVLLADVSVVVDPDGAQRELAPDFAAWRALGTHRDTRVDDGVLHVVATGPTEHMHNQVVATLSEPIANGQTYEISYRAKWLAGDVQLNTRLYFNRLARTTRLAAPAGGGTPGTVTSTNLGPTFAGLSHFPVSPSASDPVRVRVAARDPDGIADVTLFVSVDDGAPIAYAMTGDPFEATVPAAPSGAVVRFYVEARDGQGMTAWFPRRGPASSALYRVGDVVPQLGSAALPGLHIIMTPADREHFHRATELMSNADLGCTVVYGERVFYDLGVRAKGSERGRPSDARLGFNISFDPLDPLRGVLDSVSIDRSEGPGYGQREILIDQVGARIGLPSAEYNDLVYLVAPRARHTGVALLQTARFGDVMLDNQFEDGADGALFEYELVYAPTNTDDGSPTGLKLPQPDTVDGTDLRDLGPDPEAYRHVFLIKNGRRDDDYSGLIAFLGSFRGSTPRIDRDQWMRAFAYAALAGATDNYADGASHNAQFYIGSDGRALYFPHDLDFLTGNTNAAVVANNDLRRLLDLGGKRTFYQALYDLIAVAYNDTYLAHWRDHFAALVPGQDFAGRHAFMVQRSAFVTDAIRAAIPPIDFVVSEVTTNGVSGTAWLDVHSITIDGHAYDTTWTRDVEWHLAASLAAGPHTVEARDRHGAPLASAAIHVD